MPEFISPDGQPLPGGAKPFAGLGGESETKLPFEFEGLGTGLTPPLDGRQYGWVCEVDPVNRTLKKHTALGRFRHENVALRCEAGRPLVAYMGDDRRGGHVWKYVSDGVVADPKDKANSKLLEAGTLYVARLKDDFTGEWVSLQPTTRLRRPEPELTSLGHVCLPLRPDGGHAVVGGDGEVERRDSVRGWMERVEQFATVSEGWSEERLVLLDLVRGTDREGKLAGLGVGGEAGWLRRQHGILLMDAYVMANAVGGTPSARPEDLEVHPHDRSVYVAFTDSTGSGDGSPDRRIFPDSAGENSRQYGAIYRIVEDGDDPAGTTFTWGKFVSSGEVHDGGGGFACADNLTFDPAGNLWMVCDITTPAHNHAVTRADPAAAADPVAAGGGGGVAAVPTRPGDKNFPGVFGNNAMFMIPTAGPRAGVPACFAVGPCESELTGPTFTPDGRTLLLAVQHPGELHGARGLTPALPPQTRRTMRLAARDGAGFDQARIVPLGSNFPAAGPPAVPRPCVVAISRA